MMSKKHIKKNNNINLELSIQENKWNKEFSDVKEIVRNICNTVFNNSEIMYQAKGIEISVLLTNDKFMHEMNLKFRNKDKPTNVLSFPLTDIDPNDYSNFGIHDNEVMIGDIALSFETIKREAIEQNKKFIDHFTHMMVHGILHLLGFDHENEEDAQIMENKEINILKEFNINNPYN